MTEEDQEHMTIVDKVNGNIDIFSKLLLNLIISGSRPGSDRDSSKDRGTDDRRGSVDDRRDPLLGTLIRDKI